MADHSNPIAWTDQMRRELYVGLKRRFGPRKDWRKTVPTCEKSKYDQFLNELSAKWGFGDRKGDAIKNQIRFALQQSTNKVKGTQFDRMIENQRIAVEVGFMSRNETAPAVQDYL